MTQSLEPKSPNEQKLYTWNLTPRLAAKGTTITMINSITLSTGTVLAQGIDSTSRKITALLGGGAADEIMNAVAQYTTADGQTLEAAIDVPIRTA